MPVISVVDYQRISKKLCAFPTQYSPVALKFVGICCIHCGESNGKTENLLQLPPSFAILSLSPGVNVDGGDVRCAFACVDAVLVISRVISSTYPLRLPCHGGESVVWGVSRLFEWDAVEERLPGVTDTPTS
jgi:hypothetical protein